MVPGTPAGGVACAFGNVRSTGVAHPASSSSAQKLADRNGIDWIPCSCVRLRDRANFVIRRQAEIGESAAARDELAPISDLL
jgi:hypothetical protein